VTLSRGRQSERFRVEEAGRPAAGYAAAVASDERFAKTKPNWTFLLLGNQMDCAVTVRAQQANRP
jgi:hypothetical protein